MFVKQVRELFHESKVLLAKAQEMREAWTAKLHEEGIGQEEVKYWAGKEKALAWIVKKLGKMIAQNEKIARKLELIK